MDELNFSLKNMAQNIFSMDHSTVQHSTLQYSTVQHSTLQYSTVQNSTEQFFYLLASSPDNSILLWELGPGSEKNDVSMNS
jgi:hypothetical protein